jgi:hypothetical protein
MRTIAILLAAMLATPALAGWRDEADCAVKEATPHFESSAPTRENAPQNCRLVRRLIGDPCDMPQISALRAARAAEETQRKDHEDSTVENDACRGSNGARTIGLGLCLRARWTIRTATAIACTARRFRRHVTTCRSIRRSAHCRWDRPRGAMTALTATANTAAAPARVTAAYRHGDEIGCYRADDRPCCFPCVGVPVGSWWCC